MTAVTSNLGENFGKYGKSFQINLMTEIIKPNNRNPETNNIFGEEIIDHLDAKHFTFSQLKRLFVFIKEYYTKYANLPNPDNLYTEVETLVKDDTEKEKIKSVIDYMAKRIEKSFSEKKNNDSTYTKTKAFEFIRQQETIQATENAKQYISNGNLNDENIFEIVKRFEKVNEIGKPQENGIEVFENSEKALSDNFRTPIPLGIPSIDKALKGGIGSGQLLFFLAGQGKGKSSILTIVGDTSYKMGNNVLHVLLEGTEIEIQRKYYTRFTGFSDEELSPKRQEVLKSLREFKKNHKDNLKYNNRLTIRRFPDDTTPLKLKKWIAAYEKKNGFKYDIILLDYIDCLRPDTKVENKYIGEEEVTKAVESMANELKIPIVGGVQAKKESNDKEWLVMDDCGGSVEKLKKAHAIISIGRNNDMMEQSLANFSLIKCRFAQAGKKWSNATFDNDYLRIQTNDTEASIESLDKARELPHNNTKQISDNTEKFEKEDELITQIKL